MGRYMLIFRGTELDKVGAASEILQGFYFLNNNNLKVKVINERSGVCQYMVALNTLTKLNT